MFAQRYVSPELTHFVGRGLSEEQQYSVLVEKILGIGWLKTFPGNDDPQESIASGFMAGGGLPSDPTDATSAPVVCFCDIPVTDLGIHMHKYSRFGLSFLKPFLIAKGANPVLYVANNSLAWPIGLRSREPVESRNKESVEGPRPRREVFQGSLALYRNFAHAAKRGKLSPFRETESEGLTEAVRTFWNVDQFFNFYVFSFIKYFDDSTSDEDPANVYMEREWRVLGDVNFSLSDVHRVFMPEHYAQRFRADLPEYAGQLSFSDKI